MFRLFLILGVLISIDAISCHSNTNKVHKPLRWGIVSSGKIVHDFVNALSSLPKSEHQVIAVAARKLESAQEFAKQFDIPNAYEGYLAIAQNPDIDVVYVGTINAKHFENVELMLNHNKSVLCEKPLTLNYKQSKKLVDLARQKKLFLSEGIWSRAFPIYKDLIDIIDSGKIGNVKHIYADLGYWISDQKGKLFVKALGGSSIITLGIYPLQLSQLIFKERPTNISAHGLLNNDGVDISVSALLGYSNGRSTLLQTGYTASLDGTATIYGEKGRIIIYDFVYPHKLEVKVGDETVLTKDHPYPNVEKPCNYGACGGFVYEAEQVKKCLDEGLTENPLITLDQSLELAEIEDEIRRIVGVTYAEDL